jgi:hypothetical protein
VAKKKPRVDDSFILFDVIYEDGRRSSRRRVQVADLDPYTTDADADAITLIMAQDRKIAEVSGHERGAIKSIARSPG